MHLPHMTLVSVFEEFAINITLKSRNMQQRQQLL